MVDVEAGPGPIPEFEAVKNKQILSRCELISGGWLWLGIFEVRERMMSWPNPPSVYGFWLPDLLDREHIGSGRDYHGSKRWLSVGKEGDLQLIDIGIGTIQTYDQNNVREILGWGKCLVTRQGWLVDFYYNYRRVSVADVRINRRFVKPPARSDEALTVVRIDLATGTDKEDLVVIDWRTRKMLPKEIFY